ncbi:hypothetical protein WHI96_08065 [Pseudonocardia tropica]|uniref:Uncharacterized protein n=1 Tax=Pseudonocardia tropica TaxID=681289 RepID=A0ABV1JS55_9PSEU
MTPSYRSLLDGVELPVDESPVPKRVRDRALVAIAQRQLARLDESLALVADQPSSVANVLEFGLAHPGGISAAEVQAALGLSPRTLKRANRVLQERGLASYVTEYYRGGRTSSWQYEPVSKLHNFDLDSVPRRDLDSVPSGGGSLAPSQDLLITPVNCGNSPEVASEGEPHQERDLQVSTSMEVQEGLNRERMNPVTHLPVAVRTGGRATGPRPSYWRHDLAEIQGTPFAEQVDHVLDIYWGCMTAGGHPVWVDQQAKIPGAVLVLLAQGASVDQVVDGIRWMFSGVTGSGCRRPDTLASFEAYVTNSVERPVLAGADANERRQRQAQRAATDFVMTLQPVTPAAPVEPEDEATRASKLARIRAISAMLREGRAA